ncbi:MAG TPA: nucleotide exchange factor GrpE [Alphaproteobacteria bacterium]
MTIFNFIKKTAGKAQKDLDMNEQTHDDNMVEELENDAAEMTTADTAEITGPDLEAEVASWKDKAMRLAAEMENLRKRSQRDQEDALKYGISNAAKQFLSVADNLERAINAVPVDAIAASDAMANLLSGIEATQKDLLNALSKVGVTPIPTALGDKLDPQIHEVMFDVPTDQQAANTVIHILETGYKLHDRLLRPTRVAVVKANAGNNNASAVDLSA